MSHTKTTRTVTIYHQASADSPDLELTADVSDWARDEFDIEWTGDSQHIIDGLDRATEKRLEQRAREAWFDVHASLAQDTERDEAIDHQLAVYKEQRETSDVWGDR